MTETLAVPAPRLDASERELIVYLMTRQDLMDTKIDAIAQDLKTVLQTDAQIKEAVTTKLTALQQENAAQAEEIAMLKAAQQAQADQLDSVKVDADAAVTASTELLGLVAPTAPV